MSTDTTTDGEMREMEARLMTCRVTAMPLPGPPE